MRVVKTFFVFLGIILFAAALPAQTDNTSGNSSAPKTTAASKPQDEDDVTAT